METICIIADGYPYGESSHCVFVRDLAVEFAGMGKKCTIIVPQIAGKQKLPYQWQDSVADSVLINVYAPTYIACSSKPGLVALTMFFHRLAVRRTLKREKIVPDVVYGHFLYLNGLTAIEAAKGYHAASFVACGENSNRLLPDSRPYSTGLKIHGWKQKLNRATGFICVSGENERLLKKTGFIDPSKSTCVIPNGVNTSVFQPLSREDARRRLGINENDFVVIFVGALILRKGNRRVDEAAKGLEDVKTIFLGNGEFSPESDCIYCGTVLHDDIPKYLSAADVFVLPTTGEGCCNAIIEAVCCGLPVISSSGRFNDEILSDDYSIRVDPMSIDEIRDGILKLQRDRVLLKRMGEAALKASGRFSLKNRASRILDYMEGR